MIGSDNLEQRSKKPLINKCPLQSLSKTTDASIRSKFIITVSFADKSCVKCLSSHPYLDKTASKNSRLINANFSSFIGKDDNNIDALSEVTISLGFNCAGVI